MSNSGSASSGLAKGKAFAKQLLYAQYVNAEKDVICKIPELLLEDYILQEREKFCDLEFSEYLKNPKSNIEMLKLGLRSSIRQVYVYSNPLPIAATLERLSVRNALNLPDLPSVCDVTIHAFVVFKTDDFVTGEEMWWSLEKNGRYTVLQNSPNKEDVVDNIYDVEKKEFVKRLEPVKELTSAASSYKLQNLFNIIWEKRQFSTKYHLIKANCQNFASFVFEKANCEGKTWSTFTSGLVDSLAQDNPKNDSGVEADAIRHYWLLKSDRREFYLSLIEEKDFPEVILLLEKYPINEEDSQGYTLLEWAEAFSRDDVRNYLEKKGAVRSESFRRNVFFIALQYLDSEDELNDPKLSFGGIDLTGLNQTEDTPLHLALYGGKWKIAKKMLEEIKKVDLNAINSLYETLIHLSAKLESCPMELFKILLNQMDPVKVNIVDNFGYAPLHYAVDVRLPNKKKIKLLLARGADINSKSRKGFTALHFALWHKSKSVTKEFLRHVKRVDGRDVEDADVNLKDDYNQAALNYACWWSDISAKVFQIILDKSEDVNGQDMIGRTALIVALISKNKVAAEQLLKCCKKRPDGTVESVDVNIRNDKNETALHWAAAWPKIPVELFREILERTAVVNAKDNSGNTALDFALKYKSKTAVELLSERK